MRKKEVMIEKNNLLTMKESIRLIKFMSILGIMVCSIISLTVTSLCSLAVISIKTGMVGEILSDSGLIEFISKIHFCSSAVTINMLSNNSLDNTFIIFYIVIPSVLILLSSIFLIIFFKKLLDFIKDIRGEKSLFTKKKLYELINLKNILLLVGFLIVICFINNIYLYLLYLILLLILEFIVYLFEHCITKNK